MTPAPTFDEQISCVARELALRKACYPKWVSNGRMKKEEADRELARMEAVMASLKELRDLKSGGV